MVYRDSQFFKDLETKMTYDVELEVLDGVYSKYRLSCGHEKVIQRPKFKNKKFRCEICRLESRNKHLEEIGVEILDEFPGKRDYKHIKFKNCGHEKLVSNSALRNNNLRCGICLDLQVSEKCEKFNLQFIKRYINEGTGLFIVHTCGHMNVFQIGNAVRGSYKCRERKESYLVKPSNFYIFKIITDELCFIKFGFSLNINRRIKQIQKDNCKIEILKIIKFDTGKEAEDFEYDYHLKYSKYKLPVNVTMKYLTSGYTECYDISVLEEMEDDLS